MYFIVFARRTSLGWQHTTYHKHTTDNLDEILIPYRAMRGEGRKVFIANSDILKILFGLVRLEILTEELVNDFETFRKRRYNAMLDWLVSLNEHPVLDELGVEYHEIKTV